MKNLFGYLILIVFGVTALTFITAAPRKEARVTQVVRDVRLLAGNTAPRPAAVNDSVQEGHAIRTGGESRAELTFTDQTITRVGANSVFSFGEGARQFDLDSGAMLLAVPKSAGTVRVNVGAATAAVSGFTALFEAHTSSWSKLVVLEGNACVKKRSKSKNSNPNEPCITLGPGQMLLLGPNGEFSDVKTINIKKVMQTAGLVTDFGKLPPWSYDPITVAEDSQTGAGGPPPGPPSHDLTGTDAQDQKNNGAPMPAPPIKPPPSPPGKGLRH